ncbi:MAG TPA: hypothetical protein VND66_07705 [Acidobacteriaceae bacterium]|nr:hypothetical protein [Acidobacteriaceae bacterium]
MIERRDFLKTAIAGAAGWMLAPSLFDEQALADAPATIGADGFRFSTGSMVAELSRSAPEFAELNIDGLGLGKRGANIFQPPSAEGYTASVASSVEAHRIEYRTLQQNPADEPAWAVELSNRKILLISSWSEGVAPGPLVFRFDLAKCHSTVLGLFRKDETLSIPALLHLPLQGSMRLTANVSEGIGLEYHSERKARLATLAFPAATESNRRMVYTLEVTAIYPQLPGIANDSRFDAFKRNWLNGLQLNPETRLLSNNTASDSCAFCYYEFADIAVLSPPLVEGLTAMDVVRQTLDGILAGAQAYGMAAPDRPADCSDTLPSMLIAAADCVRAGNSDAWLKDNYTGIQGWVDSMMATDKNGNGLVKYAVSGNSGIWSDGAPKFRPSNWWDTIGFGYEDAYSNALAYRSLRGMAMMAARVGKPEDAARYVAAANKLRDVYYKTFYDPKTGVLGGWRSADGQLHDYYFLWVNGIAIHYGLVPKQEANSIMDKLLAKMQEVGYDKFNLGLPGNLITVALKDYVDRRGPGRYGGGVLADNSDGFQNYENGGATGCFAFWTLAALYDLGRKQEADRILFPMLDAYGQGGFQGWGPNGHSNDWRRWDGTPMGYEGYLCDNYYTLLAVPLRQSEIRWKNGFRAETTLT